MDSQLPERQRVIASVKLNRKMRTTRDQNRSARLCRQHQYSGLRQIHRSNLRNSEQAHDACTGWARTTFAPEKYKLTQFTRKSNRFDMTASLRIENSVIKPKSDVRVLEVQLNMKLGWGSHLRQIEAGHATRMLALSCLEAFT